MTSVNTSGRFVGDWPRIGIRPAVDGRMPGVRESLEVQTRNMALRTADLMSVMWRPFVASLLGGAAVLLVQQQFQPTRAITQLSVDGLTFLALYAGTWLALPGGPKILSGLAGLLAELRSPKASNA